VPQLSQEQVSELWLDFRQLETEDYERRSIQFIQEQPYLAAALVKQDVEWFGGRQMIFYHGVFIWFAFMRTHSIVPPVSAAILQVATEQQRFFAKYVNVEPDAESQEQVTEKLQTHPQPKLLQVIMREMGKQVEEMPDLPSTGSGAAYVYLNHCIVALGLVAF
jgi:hypothetical protein